MVLMLFLGVQEYRTKNGKGIVSYKRKGILMKKVLNWVLICGILLSLVQLSVFAVDGDISNNVALQEGEQEAAMPLATTKENLIVVVPGILGSKLKIGTNTIWPNADLSKIQFTESGSSLYNVSYEDSTYGSLNTYKTLVDTLTNTYSSVADVVFFSYDWRYSCSTAATRLKNLINSYSGQIVIVAHSMGGLVSSEYLRIATISQRQRTTLITMGTPFTGSAKVFPVIDQGDATGHWFIKGMTANAVKEYVKNIPAVYELLPTSRSEPFMKKSGTTGYLSYQDSIALIKTLPWAKKSNGSVKPMLSSAQSFIAGIDNVSGTHYAYFAKATYHFAANGLDTPRAIEYVYNSTTGTYEYGALIYSNSGDGTVLLSSAINKLSTTDSRAKVYRNVDDHSNFISNESVVLKNLKLCINPVFNLSSAASFDDEFLEEPTYENSRGWLIAPDLDGRRININANHVAECELYAANGEVIEQEGNRLFYVSDDGCRIEVGSKWITGIGFQYALYSGDYRLSIRGENSDSQVLISYMENGYYDKYIEFQSLNMADQISFHIGNYTEQTVVVDVPTTSAATTANDIGSHEYTETELQMLNQD